MISLKRTHDLFVGNHGQKVPLDEEAQWAKIACKVRGRRQDRPAARWVPVPVPAGRRV